LYVGILSLRGPNQYKLFVNLEIDLIWLVPPFPSQNI
jgi:hypothetical protein